MIHFGFAILIISNITLGFLWGWYFCFRDTEKIMKAKNYDGAVTKEMFKYSEKSTQPFEKKD